MDTKITEHNAQHQRNQRIRAGFVLQGSSLRDWCLHNDVQPQNAHRALKGQWTGIKASDLVKRIEKATKEIT